MFSSTPDPTRSVPRSLRAALRNAADLAVAFVTLEGYGLDDLRPGRPSSSDVHTGESTDDAAARPGAPWAEPAAVDPKHPHRRSLRTHPRERRPGIAPRAEELCTTPLHSSEPLHAARAPSRRRTTSQDAPR